MDRAKYTAAVAESVTRRMEEQGESILSLSNKTGIPYSTLRRRCLGLKTFTVDDLAAIGLVLDLDPADFLFGLVAA